MKYDNPVELLRKTNLGNFHREVKCPAHYVQVKVHLIPCPSVGILWQMVQHLNDHHQWSREKIADWIEDSGLNFELKPPAE